jgi:hypothetical protein
LSMSSNWEWSRMARPPGVVSSSQRPECGGRFLTVYKNLRDHSRIHTAKTAS